MSNDDHDGSHGARDLETRIEASEGAAALAKATGIDLAGQTAVNTAGAVGGALGGAVGLTIGGPVGAAVGAAVGSVAMTSGGSVLLNFLQRGRALLDEQRATRFFNEAASRRVEIPEDPVARERFLRTLYARLRDALDAFDDAVIPAIVAMLAEYEARPLDPFFRACARVLRDLSREEYGDLRTLTAWMLWTMNSVEWPRGAARVVLFEHIWNGERAWCRDGERACAALNTARVSAWPPPIDSWPVLVARLRSEGVFDRVTLERVDDRAADAIPAVSLHAMARVLDVTPIKGPPAQ